MVPSKGTGRHDTVCHGTVRHGTVCHGTVCHGTVCHGTSPSSNSLAVLDLSYLVELDMQKPGRFRSLNQVCNHCGPDLT